MATYLLAATPIHGHVGPILRVAKHLAAKGHRVILLTGKRFAGVVEEAGALFEPLTGRANFDDRDQDSYLPDRNSYTGIRRAQYEIRSIFIETIPDQARALRALIDQHQPDAVLVDGAFAGALPLLSPRESSSAARPPILALGVTPLSQSSSSLAPYGMALPPATTPVQQLRYRLLNVVARQAIFRPTQRAARRAMTAAGGMLDCFIMDSSREYDRFLQTGPEGLEYPRRDLSPLTQFVGVLPQPPAAAPLPGWWADLDGSRPVVHVTQGTIDNTDFGRLIQPTITALQDSDCLVIITGGGRSTEDLGMLPENVRAADYLPYGELLGKTDVFITNGGYGGVQAAIAHGVPVIVAGDTEEKPEVAARIGWSGAGINLHTGTPTPQSIQTAVDTILTDPRYTQTARRLAAETKTHHTLDEIEAALHTTTPRPKEA